MKKIILTLAAAFAILTASAQQQIITLPAPSHTSQATLDRALTDRHSTRNFAATPLTTAELSDLLWAANGVNRPATGGRTAASAMNRQEVDVYVLLKDGAYLYDANAGALNLIVAKDLRALAAGRQTSVAEAPAILLLVSDADKFKGRGGEQDLVMRGVDVGIVSANISLHCAAAGLGTVPRGSMETAALREALSLGEAQTPMLNHPVGRFAE